LTLALVLIGRAQGHDGVLVLVRNGFDDPVSPTTAERVSDSGNMFMLHVPNLGAQVGEVERHPAGEPSLAVGALTRRHRFENNCGVAMVVLADGDDDPRTTAVFENVSDLLVGQS